MTKTTEIIVASKNPVKIQAARSAFAQLLPDAQLRLSGISVDSGVSEQPSSDVETRTGARNRAERAMQEQPIADFAVGMEGGIELIGEQLLAFAWIAVRSADGRAGEARTATLPLPDAVRRFVEQGLELGDASDRVFATVNSKQSGGAFGLLTDGLFTRESIYAQSLVLALLPLVNPVYR